MRSNSKEVLSKVRANVWARNEEISQKAVGCLVHLLFVEQVWILHWNLAFPEVSLQKKEKEKMIIAEL